MSQCCFHGSNIERVDLTDSKWAKRNFVIWEEYQSELSSNWNELEGIYRRLKQSYQKFGDNSTSSEFYYREMECKRKQMRFFQRTFWNIFYKKLCGYGALGQNSLILPYVANVV